MSDEFRLPIGEVVDKRWQLNKLLGAGAFGAVYEVIDLADANRPTYALKLEKNNLRDRSMNLLKLEVTVLRYLREAKAKHCPGYVSCGQAPQYNFVVMGLVGKSVSETRKMMPNRRFTLRTCLHIGIEGVKSIDEIHQVGFIHRDYKPANLAVGRSPDGLRSIFLLDWGLCRRYVNIKGQLLPARPVAPFRGTPRYASPNALALKEQGRLDDMWSWLYTLIDLTVGQLPWDDGLPDDSDEQVDYLRVEKAKAAKEAERLLRGCPLEYCRLLKYLNSLKFADPPNYARFRRMLHKVVSRKQLQTLPLDWEPTSNLYTLMKEVPNASMVYTPPRKVEDLEEDDYEQSSKTFL